MSFFLAPDALTFTGPGDRFQKNIAALTLAHALEASERPATNAERRILAHYLRYAARTP